MMTESRGISSRIGAASDPGSQAFVLIGALIATPVILTYTGFAYWVFHGKTPAAGY